jgi:dihydroxyacetone kinase-like protein
MSKKVLITGGAGFIGSALSSHLQGLGHDVFVLDDLSFGKRQLAGVPDDRFFQVDMRDRRATEKVFEATRPNWVLHLAAIHFIPYCNLHPVEATDININGTISVLDAAETKGSVEQVFVTTGTAMMTSMGGASGALFGTVYRAGGKALAGRAAFDSEGLALLLEAALEGVMKRGGAKPGDKTMIDALAPAAAKAREVTAHDLTDAFAAVAAEAEAGKEASKAMVAQFGRAKTLGEACIGFPDAGACSVTIMLSTMRDFVSA